MEIVKKFWMYAVAAVLVIAAIAFYFTSVRALGKTASGKLSSIEQRRTQLDTRVKKIDDIPNPTWIKAVKEKVQQEAKQIDDCALYLAMQPRRCHTIRFFEQGQYGPEIEISLDRPNQWRKAYESYNSELLAQLREAAISMHVEEKSSLWGSGVPTPEQIAESMRLYWFQKDMADFFTQQVEKDLSTYILSGTVTPSATISKPSDLVINKNPARLEDALRAFDQKKLVAVLSAILVNTKEWDLNQIFNNLLPDETDSDGKLLSPGLPWERPPADQSKPSILGLLLDDNQRKFLEEMLPPGTPDLSNKSRFLDLINEYRMVRYRPDVIALLERNRNFSELAGRLREATEVTQARILEEIAGTLTSAQLAEAINTVVSIKNETEYALIKSIHAPDFMALETWNFSFDGSPAESSNYAGICKVHSFAITLQIDFERIPIFMRRLTSNSWLPKAWITSVVPISSAGSVKTTSIGGTPSPGTPASRVKAPEGPSQERHAVKVNIVGEAYQFTPLLPKLTEKERRTTTLPTSPSTAVVPAARS